MNYNEESKFLNSGQQQQSIQRPANDQTKTRVQRIKDIISNYAENKSQPIVKQKETIINSSMATDQMKMEKADDEDEIIIKA